MKILTNVYVIPFGDITVDVHLYRTNIDRTYTSGREKATRLENTSHR